MSERTSEALVVALGTERYRVERPWGALPAHNGIVTDVAADERDHVFVLLRTDPLADAPAPPVVELAPDGSFVAAWGEGLIADAHKMRFAEDGTLWIVDRDAHFVGHFDTCGRLLDGLGVRHEPGRPFQHPTDVAGGPDGKIFVADGYANSRIHCFGPGGELLASWGESGTAPGQLSVPHAVCLIGEDRLLVADRDNDRLQIFRMDGEFLRAVDGYCRPTALWVRKNGGVLVIDQAPRLSLIDGEGRLQGRCRPVLNGAHGLCGNSRGEIFLAEGNPSRITRLVPSGR